MKKIMTAFLAIVMFFDVVSLGVMLVLKDKAPEDNGEVVIEDDKSIFNKVSFVAAGDNLIHETVYEQAAQRTSGTYDFRYAYENIISLLDGADQAIINQETLISTKHNVAGYPLYNSPAELGEEMIKLGFNVFNMANNHALDYGEEGLVSAINFWKERGVTTVGAYETREDSAQLTINEINGIKIAYLGFTESTNGKSLPEDSKAHIVLSSEESYIRQMVMDASEKADFVVVYAHWGDEYENDVTQAQRDLAAKISSWGADLIIGSHSHVLQPVEYIDNPNGKRTLVAYSLGNFISASDQVQELLGGVLSFTLSKNEATGEISMENLKVRGVVTHYGYSTSNIRIYPLSSYTDDLASRHGIKEKVSDFSTAYLTEMFSKIIGSQFA